MTGTVLPRPRTTTEQSPLGTTYAWNLYAHATVDAVWTTIRALFQGLAAAPSWETDPVGQPLLVVRGATALGQARELGYTLAADQRQPPTEVTWQVRAVDGGVLVGLTVHDPDNGWDAEVENAWLPLLGRLARMLSAADR